MNAETRPDAAQARINAQTKELLRELEACGHHGARLLERTGLPFWARGMLFRGLGYVAKGSGRVLPTDIQYAETLLRSFGSRRGQRRRLIRQFSTGKEDSDPQVPRWLRLLSRRWPSTALRVGISLGHLCHPPEGSSTARSLRVYHFMVASGIPGETANAVLRSYRRKEWITRPGPMTDAAPSSFEQACKTLGGSPDDSLDALKRAYRKGRSRYHPDRAIHSGMDPATARARLEELNKAWELINRRHPETF